jgi:hypothetical protein
VSIYLSVEFGFFAAAVHEGCPGFAVGFAADISCLVINDVAGFMDDGVALFGFIDS